MTIKVYRILALARSCSEVFMVLAVPAGFLGLRVSTWSFWGAFFVLAAVGGVASRVTRRGNLVCKSVAPCTSVRSSAVHCAVDGLCRLIFVAWIFQLFWVNFPHMGVGVTFGVGFVMLILTGMTVLRQVDFLVGVVEFRTVLGLTFSADSTCVREIETVRGRVWPYMRVRVKTSHLFPFGVLLYGPVVWSSLPANPVGGESQD